MAQADTIIIDQDFARVTSSGIVITPSGGSQTTLGAALALAGSATTINVLSYGASPSASAAVNTAAIQKALNAAAGVARVYIPFGTFTVGALTLTSNTHLTIDGTLFLAAGTNLRVLRALNQSNIIIDGVGTIDGNKTNNSYTGGSNFLAGIWIGTCDNVRISGLTIQNCVNWPFSIDTSSNCTVEKVKALNCGNSAQLAFSTFNTVVTDCFFSGMNDIGFAFYQAPYNCAVVNCQVTGSAAAGIAILHDGGQNTPSHDILITGCTVYGNQLGAISVTTGAATSGNHTNVVITNNLCYNNNLAGTGVGGGIYLSTVDGAVVFGNTVYGDTAGPAGLLYGIAAISGSIRILITSNMVYNEGVGGTAAIGIFCSAANTTMNLNTIFDDQLVKSMAYGLFGSVGSGVTAIGNTIGTMLTASNGLTNNSDTVVAGPSAGAFSVNALTVTGAMTINATTQDASLAIVAAATGNTLAVSSAISTVIYTAGGTLATLTINLPATPINKQVISITVQPAITALTVAATGGQTVTGAAITSAASAANANYKYIYVTSQTSWYRIL